MTVIAVTGGRAYADLVTVRRVIAYYSPSLVIHGGATGADSLAESVARELGIQTERHDADWLTHPDRIPGPKRRKEGRLMGRSTMSLPVRLADDELLNKAKEVVE